MSIVHVEIGKKNQSTIATIGIVDFLLNSVFKLKQNSLWQIF